MIFYTAVDEALVTIADAEKRRMHTQENTIITTKLMTERASVKYRRAE